MHCKWEPKDSGQDMMCSTQPHFDSHDTITLDVAEGRIEIRPNVIVLPCVMKVKIIVRKPFATTVMADSITGLDDEWATIVIHSEDGILTVQQGDENFYFYSDYFLYATGRYEQGDLRKDLKTIYAVIFNTSAEYVSIEEDVLPNLLRLAYRAISYSQSSDNAERSFGEFAIHLNPEERWKIGARGEEDFTNVILINCLSVLRKALEDNDFILDEPSSSVLPLVAQSS